MEETLAVHIAVSGQTTTSLELTFESADPYLMPLVQATAAEEASKQWQESEAKLAELSSALEASQLREQHHQQAAADAGKQCEAAEQRASAAEANLAEARSGSEQDTSASAGQQLEALEKRVQDAEARAAAAEAAAEQLQGDLSAAREHSRASEPGDTDHVAPDSAASGALQQAETDAPAARQDALAAQQQAAAAEAQLAEAQAAAHDAKSAAADLERELEAARSQLAEADAEEEQLREVSFMLAGRVVSCY